MNTLTMNPMLSYAVVGYFRDNNQPFTCPVRAAFPLVAAEEAVREMLSVNGWDADYADDIVIVAILGHNPDADVVEDYDLPEVVSGAEFLGESADSSPDILALIAAN